MAAIPSCTAAVCLGVLVLSAGALESDALADVTGKVSLTGSAGKPPERGRAFLSRTENPYLGGQMFDPMPYLVVVLEGEGVEATGRPQVKWRLLGESFDRPLLPVVVGTEVLIQNDGRRSPVLYLEGDPDRLPKSPLDPSIARAFPAGEAGTLHRVRDADAPYLAGAVLVLASPYFAVPGRDGKYRIDTANLRDGSYTLRVWYRDGWLEEAATPVQVERGKATKDLTLPPGLTTVPAKR
jgi:hypothetical protein